MAKSRPKQRYGECLTRGIRVRVTPEIYAALRSMKRVLGVPYGEAVRLAILRVLDVYGGAAVAEVRRDATPDMRKLKLLDFVRQCKEAERTLLRPDLARSLREAQRQIAMELRDQRRKLRKQQRKDASACGSGPCRPSHAQPSAASRRRPDRAGCGQPADGLPEV
ncbi:MAG: hypothetical protein ACYTHJ_07410 [Planctomycetota bacterium]|jgi:hypothetical protein